MLSSVSLLDYLESQNQLALDRLYADKYTCQAILRALPPLSRQYVLRLVGAHGELPMEIVKSWPLRTSEAQRKHEEALKQLDALRLLSRQAGAGGSTFKLHVGLCDQLLRSLCAVHTVDSGGEPSAGADKHAPSVSQLERHAQSTWEAVLQCVLTPPPQQVALAVCQGRASLQDLLHAIGLLEPAAAGMAHVGGARPQWCSSRGARLFVLLPSNSQASHGARYSCYSCRPLVQFPQVGTSSTICTVGGGRRALRLGALGAGVAADVWLHGARGEGHGGRARRDARLLAAAWFSLGGHRLRRREPR